MNKRYCIDIEFQIKRLRIKAESLESDIERIKNGNITDLFDEHTPKEVIETVVGLKEHELKLLKEYQETLRAEISTVSLCDIM